jgi:hypothetical protein
MKKRAGENSGSFCFSAHAPLCYLGGTALALHIAFIIYSDQSRDASTIEKASLIVRQAENKIDQCK